MKTISLCLVTLILLCSCRSGGARRIDPTSPDEGVTTAKLDFRDIVEVAGDMATDLVSNSFLSYRDNYPVLMVLSDIENNTDMRNLPTDSILGRVRSIALNSGKIRFVSSLGAGSRDDLTGEIQDIANDPRFKKDEAPPRGSLRVPQYSLRTEINYLRGTDGRQTQRTYDFHMFVSDLKTGEILWEQFKPIGKAVSRGGIGF